MINTSHPIYPWIKWGALTVFSGMIISSVSWFFILYNEPAPTPDLRRRILTPIVRAGDDIKIQNSFIQSNKCFGRFYRSIYDSSGTLIWTQEEPRPPETNGDGRKRSVIRAISIPKSAAPGPAEYKLTIEWTCNIVQRINPHLIQLPTFYFEILPAKEDRGGLGLLKENTEPLLNKSLEPNKSIEPVVNELPY